MSIAEKLLSSLANQRLLIIGDLMLDIYIWGKATRLSPEAPVPVLEVTSETCYAGGAANVARNAAALGAKVDLIGVIGDDPAGISLRAELAQAEIGDHLFVLPDRPTTQKRRVMASGQQLVRIDYEETTPLSEWAEEVILQKVEVLLEQTDAIILSDYQKGVLTGNLASSIIHLARKRDIPVVADTKAQHLHAFHGSIITPNRLEAERATGCRIQDPTSLMDAGAILARQVGTIPIVITLGEDGIALLEPDQPPFVIPAISTSVFDVTGAGDTVVSSFTLALAAGFTARESVVMANYAAAVVVREVGTAVCTVEKLQALIRESGEYWNSQFGSVWERVAPYGT